MRINHPQPKPACSAPSRCGLVSIIIPVLDRWEYTRTCLNSIRENTPADRYEIIVMDNGSANETRTGLQSFSWVRVIRSDQKLTFAQSNNLGAVHACGEFLLFLNNDTRVTPGWLEPLANALQNNPAPAAAGPLLLYPDKTVQHAGVVFSEQRMPFHFAVGWRSDHPGLAQPRYFKAITGACLICRKQEFLDIGGFDELFVNGYEDIDLCLRWHEKNRGILFVPSSVVFHHESKTPGRHDLEHLNIQRYFVRWAPTTDSDYLKYYAEAHHEHSELPMLGLVIAADMSADCHNALQRMLSDSTCALRILITLSQEVIEPVTYGNTVTICGRHNSVVIEEWFREFSGQPRNSGLLYLSGPGILPPGWDDVLIESAESTTPVLCPHPDGTLVQQLQRYTDCAPPAIRNNPTLLTAYMKSVFSGFSAWILSGTPVAMFLPSPFSDDLGYSRIIDGIHTCSDNQTPKPVKLDLPVMTKHTQSAPAGLKASVILYWDQLSSPLSVVEKICESAGKDVEILVFLSTPTHDETTIRQCLEAGVYVFTRPAPTPWAMAMDRLARASVGQIMVFLAENRVDEAIGESVDRIEKSQVKALVLPDGSLVVRKIDFLRSGGMRPDLDKTAALTDIITRLN